MSLDPTTWPTAHHSISSGQSTCALHLRVALGRELNENDKRVIAKAMRELETDLLAESARLHPDNVEWKKNWLHEARELFEIAGLGPIYVREIDNKYCGPKCCPQRVWLLVTTQLGVIEIGWRKSVMAIDWSASDVKATAEDLFADEKVTKGEKMIHAHDYRAAHRYLVKIRESASSQVCET